MPMCIAKEPPLFRTDPRRVAACYLYRDAPAIKPEELTNILADAPPSASDDQAAADD
jgi:hypothetical protein